MRYFIVYEDNIVCQFAAEELQKYVHIMSGELLRRGLKPKQGFVNIYLGKTPWLNEIADAVEGTDSLKDDGYIVDVTDKCIRITGNEDRSVLYGTYHMLKSVGCRWLFPGDKGEFIPKISNVCFSKCHVIENPSYTVRSLTDDTVYEPIDAFLKETAEKFDWACKNRINCYSMGGFPDIRWGRIKQYINAELAKRGFLFEFGGHETPKFVDRKLFTEKPEMFRMANGVRRADGNFCSSSSDAVQMVIDRVRNYLDEYPDLRLIHLYFDDVFGGSWCDCELCKDKSAAQQALDVINQVADMLKEEYPKTSVDFLLYHDTLDLSALKEKPRDNVVSFYAPRERCYSHSIADPDCPRNRTHYHQLLDASKMSKQVYIFEYYADMILWNKIGIDIPNVLIQDLKDYYNAGIRQISMLMFNAYSWFAYPLNMWTYVNAVWNTDVDARNLREEYCRLLYSDLFDKMLPFMEMKEKASLLLLQFCEYEHLSDIRDIPPQKPEFYKKHLSDIRESLSIFKECLEAARKYMNLTDNIDIRRLLSSEEALLEINCSQIECTLYVMEKRFAYIYEDLDKAKFNAAMDMAIDMTKRTKALGAALPIELIGVNGKDKFPWHLCDDQITCYENWKQSNAKVDRQAVER